MARPLRIQFDGALYHVTSRGNARRSIFKDNQDRLTFLNILKMVNERYHWLCHAYCLMDNHYHLVIETPDGNLSKGMRQLNGVYTQDYNRRHQQVGHVFQGRYKAILIQKESYFLEVCRYVVLNPVRAKRADNPEAWKWSSYGGTAGLWKSHSCLTVDWILRQMGRKKKQAEGRYRDFIRIGIGGPSIWRSMKGQSLLGENEYASRLMKYVKGYQDIKEIPRMQRYIGRPSLKALLKRDSVVGKERRDKKIVEAVGKYGYSQKEIADYLRMHYSTISRIVNRDDYQ